MFLISQHALQGKTTIIRKGGKKKVKNSKTPPHIPISTKKLNRTYSLTDILLKMDFHNLNTAISLLVLISNGIKSTSLQVRESKMCMGRTQPNYPAATTEPLTVQQRSVRCCELWHHLPAFYIEESVEETKQNKKITWTARPRIMFCFLIVFPRRLSDGRKRGRCTIFVKWSYPTHKITNVRTVVPF